MKFNTDVRQCKVMQVIKTITLIGEGTQENPYRETTNYWSLEGELLAELDSWNNK